MYYDSGATSPGKREGPRRKEPRRQGGARGPEVQRAAEVRRAEAAAGRPEAEVGSGAGATVSASGFPVLARGRRKRPRPRALRSAARCELPLQLAGI